MHFKMLSQNIKTMIQKETRGWNIPQYTLHLYLNLQKKKKAISPSLLFIQITANLHLHMKLNKMP